MHNCWEVLYRPLSITTVATNEEVFSNENDNQEVVANNENENQEILHNESATDKVTTNDVENTTDEDEIITIELQLL